MRFAFEYARHHGRKRLVRCCTRRTVMRLSDGLFLDCARRIAQDYPYLEVEFRAIDTRRSSSSCSTPRATTCWSSGNLDGDLLSDLCAGLVGGLGVVPGANLGDGCAVFEAVHGTAPSIAGKDLANPIGAHLVGRAHAAAHRRSERRHAIAARRRTLLEEGRALTRDLGGQASTTAMTDALLAVIERDGGAKRRRGGHHEARRTDHRGWDLARDRRSRARRGRGRGRPHRVGPRRRPDARDRRHRRAPRPGGGRSRALRHRAQDPPVRSSAGSRDGMPAAPPPAHAAEYDAPGPQNPNVLLRRRLGLFAGVVPVRPLPGYRPGFPASISCSSARSPRTSTKGSSTRSSPAWSRA